MGFAVVHMQKHKSGAVGGIQSHNNREHEPRSNPDVDMSRSGNNYDLLPCSNYRRSIKEKITDLTHSGRAVRSDAVLMCSFIITSDHDTMAAMPPAVQKSFFKDSLQWFSDRYGADRILAATVHLDEKTPHLHLSLVPITADGRLSAKSIFTKKEMSAIQTAFAAEVGSRYGLQRGVVGSDRQHLSELQYKTQTAQIELQQLTDQREALQADLSELQGKILTSQQVKEKKLYKPLLGGSSSTVKIPYSEYQDLRATAEEIDRCQRLAAEAAEVLRKESEILEAARSTAAQEKAAAQAAAQQHSRKARQQAQKEAAQIIDRAQAEAESLKAEAQLRDLETAQELSDTKQELIDTQQQLTAAQKQLTLFDRVMQHNPDLKQKFDAAVKLLNPVKKKKLSL